MRKWTFLSLLTFLVAVLPLNAQPAFDVPSAIVRVDDAEGVQVPIPMSCRVPNRTRYQCVWCSIECLARYHKIPEASHLTDDHKGKTGGGEVRQVLNRLGIKYQQQYEGNYDKKLLIDACAKGWGAGVGVNGNHMINLVHYKDGVVKVIDNSDRSLRIQTWTEQQFLQHWDGWVITLVPPGSPGDGVAPPPLAPRPPSAIR